MLAVQFLMLADNSTHNLSVKEAMKLAGFDEAEIYSSTRAKEAAVRRAYNGMKKKQLPSINLPVEEVHTIHDFPVSPLSEIQSTPSNDSTVMTTSKSVLKKMTNNMLPGMKVVCQTLHHAHALAQNALLLKKLRDSAIKETTIAWAEASELEKKGEPHKLKKEIIEMTNNKPRNKAFVQVHERTIRRLVADGIIGVTPPWRGNPGSIPPVAYRTLKDAVTSFITIHHGI
jgi:hypothetical protein